MASQFLAQHVGSRNFIESIVHSPGAATATVLTPNSTPTPQWRSMENYEYFLVCVANAVLTGTGLTLLEIVAATDSLGTNIQQIVTTGALTGSLVDNGASIEIEAGQLEEVRAAAGLTLPLLWVAARITMNNSADIMAATYVRSGAKRPFLNLTPLTF